MIGEILHSRYRIIRLLGQGGMGAVYEAEDAETGQRVAVKLIRSEVLEKNTSLVRRFEREVKATRAIESPYIARLFDAATDPATGAPYMVMELLEGEDLQQLISRVGPLPPLAALRIAAQACLGLHKAHAALVTHRDIKPANLFLVRGEGQAISVKLLDFGIAKLMGDPLQGPPSNDLTTTGSILGSPLFMSPEQMQDPRTLDHRTDIWSLGVVLYCAIAGRAPHEHIKSLAKLIVALCHRVTPPLREVAPWVSPEVAAVVHGALQKDPARRFPTAEAMLEAIRALLPDGLALTQEMLVPLPAAARSKGAPGLDRATVPVGLEAPRGGGTEVMEKPSAKQVVAVIPSSPEVSGTETTEEVGGETLLLTRAPIAESSSGKLELSPEAAGPRETPAILEAGGAPSVEPPAEGKARRAAWAFAVVGGIALAGAGAAFLWSKSPSAGLSPTAPASAAPSGMGPSAEKTDVERSAAQARNADRMAAAHRRQGDPTTVLALLREIEAGPVPRGWEELARATGYAGVATRVLPHEGAVFSAAFSADGRRIIAASGDKTVRVWNADGTGQPLVLRGHDDAVYHATFSPDGQRIVSASQDKTVRVWNADGTGQPLVLLGHDDAVSSAVWSPDGRRIVSASEDKTVRVWNADGTGQPLVLRGHTGRVYWATWSADGKHIVSASQDKTARVWNAGGRGQPLVLRGHDGGVWSAAWSPDGRRIVSASVDRTVRVWNADGTGQPLVLRGHDGGVLWAAFSPDGRRIVSASEDRTVHIWSADGRGQPLVLRGHGEEVRRAGWSPDGRRIASGSRDRTVRVWNVDGTGQPLVLRGHEDAVETAAFSVDGRRIASGSRDKTVRVWNADGTGQPLVLRGHDDGVRWAAFSPDGRRVVSASRDQTVRVWNADGTGQPLVLRGHEDLVGAAAFSPDGTRIVSASFDKTVRVWNADGTGQPLVLRGHEKSVGTAAFSHDGRRIVSASFDKTVRVWNADGTGQPIVLRGHEKGVVGAAFSPEGTRIASASFDETVRVWSADGSGQPLVLRGHEHDAGIRGDRPWSPDGTRIVSVSFDTTVRIWSADGTGEPVVLRPSSKPVHSASWSADGRRIVAALEDKTVVVWSDVEPLRDAEDPRLWAATTYCMPLEVRQRLLGFPEEQSRKDLERCERRVREAETARGPEN